MSLFLLSFEGGHHNLFASRPLAEQAAAYYPDDNATIRDLDQEARDREEMIGLLERLDQLTPTHPQPSQCGCVVCDTRALLKRLGRLP